MRRDLGLERRNAPTFIKRLNAVDLRRPSTLLSRLGSNRARDRAFRVFDGLSASGVLRVLARGVSESADSTASGRAKQGPRGEQARRGTTEKPVLATSKTAVALGCRQPSQ